ncbi:hypothetical protein BDV11DRAFT_39928 [Aspergillus similis]
MTLLKVGHGVLVFLMRTAFWAHIVVCWPLSLRMTSLAFPRKYAWKKFSCERVCFGHSVKYCGRYIRTAWQYNRCVDIMLALAPLPMPGHEFFFFFRAFFFC